MDQDGKSTLILNIGGRVMSKDNYTELRRVLNDAIKQASEGKGKARHASGEPFTQQPICALTRWLGLGFPLGQAIKKCQEAYRMANPLDRVLLNPAMAEISDNAAVAELLGAINYLAAAVIVLRERKGK